MALKLRIENVSSLPDGGPLSFTMRGQTRADIGRDQHLDWCLPDTERFISSKHCEVRLEKGEYLLDDVSTNGTFVNGSAARVQSPYRLRDGDRLQIGEYLVVVSLSRDDDGGGAPAQPVYTPNPRPEIDRPSSYGSLWDVDGDIAPAVDPKQFKPRAKASPVYGDFLYRAADVPRVTDDAQFAPVDASMDWAAATPRPASQAEPVRTPEPRRRAVPRDEAAWEEPPAAPEISEAVASPDPLPAAVAPARIPPASAPIVPVAAPPQASAVPPVAASASSATASGGDAALLRAMAEAAGLSLDTLRGRSPDELGRMLGELLVLMTEGMQQLLQARTRAKQSARSSEHTLIQPQENNPLKFSPTPQEALAVMLGSPTRSYLDATRAFANGLEDLKRHQVQTYSAMQGAVAALVGQFDPAQIGKDVPQGGALPDVLKLRKARLWDAYLASWAALKGGQPDEVIRHFMALFGAQYDRAGRG